MQMECQPSEQVVEKLSEAGALMEEDDLGTSGHQNLIGVAVNPWVPQASDILGEQYYTENEELVDWISMGSVASKMMELSITA